MKIILSSICTFYITQTFIFSRCSLSALHKISSSSPMLRCGGGGRAAWLLAWRRRGIFTKRRPTDNCRAAESSELGSSGELRPVTRVAHLQSYSILIHVDFYYKLLIAENCYCQLSFGINDCHTLRIYAMLTRHLKTFFHKSSSLAAVCNQ